MNPPFHLESESNTNFSGYLSRQNIISQVVEHHCNFTAITTIKKKTHWLYFSTFDWTDQICLEKSSHRLLYTFRGTNPNFQVKYKWETWISLEKCKVSKMSKGWQFSRVPFESYILNQTWFKLIWEEKVHQV